MTGGSGPDRTGPVSGGTQAAQDMTWQELADAVWFAALCADAESRPPATGPAPAESDAASTDPGLGSDPDNQGPQRSGDRGIPPEGGDVSHLTDTFLQDRFGVGGESWSELELIGDGADDLPPLARQPAAWTRAAGTRPRPASALPERALIARGLRPFRRSVPSRWATDLDEEETARHAAEDDLWLPYVRPATTRWLDLVVVVDEGPSMPAWQRSIAEFTRLLEQMGAFRDVRLRRLGLRRGRAEADPPRLVLRGQAADAGTNDPAELLDPTGNSVILILTDGLGAAWRTGAAQRALALWGRSASVAVIHLLPQQSWHHTAVAPHRARLRAPGAAVPNRRFSVNLPTEWRGVLDPLPDDWSVAVPVIELDKDSLEWWAKLVTGQEPVWRDAHVLLVGPLAADEKPHSWPPPDNLAPVAASGREQVLNFRANASPGAVRLATHLAAAPLEPKFIDTIQHELLPESRPVHLAEILLSGLIRPVGDEPSSETIVPLDFVDGAREALLAGAVRADTARVFAAAADHFGDRISAARGAHDALLDPDQAPDPTVTTITLPFARVERAVMEALSGPYLKRARRIGHAIAVLEQTAAAADPDLNPIHDASDEIGADMQEGNTRPSQAATEAGGLIVRTSPMDTEIALSVSPRAGVGRGRTAGGLDSRRQFAVPAVWGNVPPVNPNFTGREDLLARLHEQLQLSATAAVLPHTLHGMGGVGKSQIAIEYVYRHAGEYDVIWWVPAEQPGQILASLASLAQSLGLDVGTEANTAVPAVREALRSGHPYPNWLLVFDNAEDIGAVRTFFPTGGTGKILVTSRNPEWDRVARTLSVDVFRREESKTLLRRRNPDLTDVEADRLAEALGDLPLAIEQAASWRAATGMAVDEYLSLINEKRTELLDVAPSPDYAESVAAAWNVSLDRLAEQNPAALQVLQVCAFFAPEPISRDLFRGSRNVSIAVELDEALRDPMKLSRAIRDINRYALARIEHRTNTVQLHRLVQAVLIGRMSSEVQAQMRHGAHVLLAGANPDSPGASSQWPRYQSLLPHVNVSGAIESDDPWVRQLLSGMVRFLYFWGDHEGAVDLARRVANIWTERYGEDDAETLTVSKWLAYVSRTLGEYRNAAELNEQILGIYRRIADEDDEGTLDIMLQVDADMRIRGDFAGARENDERVLALSRRAFGDDDPATLTAAHNLGVSMRLVGDYRTAVDLDSDTWQRRAVILGEDDNATLSTLNGLAIDQRESGDYLGARLRQEETYARSVELFGVSHPFAIVASRNLAVCRRRAGDHAGARILSEDALSRFQRRYGDSYPDTLAAATNLAVDMRQTGDLEESRELSERTFAIYAQTLGERHPYTLGVRANLAVTLRLLGEVEAAAEENSAAYTALVETLGPDHPLTLTCATNRGSDRFALLDFEAALRQDTDTLERLRRVLGDDHPSTLACALNVALDYRATGKIREGDALHAETVGKLRAVLGAKHPGTVAATQGTRADADIAPMPL